MAIALLALPLVSVLFRVLHKSKSGSNTGQFFKDFVSNVVLFGVVGPLIGYASIALLSPLLGFLMPSSSFSKEPLILFSDPFLFIFIAYLFLGIPALLTGVVSGALKPWLKSCRHHAGIGLVAMAIAILWGGANLNRHGLSFMASISEVELNKNFVSIGIAAFFVGIFSARLLRDRP
ncbi:MAG TPA: hypothetical protein VN639_16865 [Azonexus sp.]|nr:hypothetical protein [Azonexus sp.]